MLSDWSKYFWDRGGAVIHFDLHLVLFFDLHHQKKMWDLCESICLHVWVISLVSCVDQHILNVTNFNTREVCLKFMILTFSNFLFKQVWSNTPTRSPPLGDSQLLWRFENRPQIFYQKIIKEWKMEFWHQRPKVSLKMVEKLYRLNLTICKMSLR